MKNAFTAILCIVSVVLTLNLVFNACKKQDFQLESSVSSPVSVQVPELKGVSFKEGRLRFTSQKDFENAISTMRLHQQTASAFEKQFTGFISSRSAYFNASHNAETLSVNDLPEYMTAIKMSDGEIYVRPSVDFHLIGNLTNPEGIVQIGNIVYKYTYWKIFKTTENYVDLLTSSDNLEGNPNIEVLPIGRLGKEVVVERSELIECEWFYQSGGSKKFHGEIKSRIYPGYSQLSVDFDHYKKIFGVWYLNNAPSMSFNGTVNAGCCNSSTGSSVCCSTVGGNACSMSGGRCIYSVSASGSDEGEIFDVLLENSSGSHFIINTPTNVRFTGKGDDNVVKSCSTIL